MTQDLTQISTEDLMRMRQNAQPAPIQPQQPRRPLPVPQVQATPIQQQQEVRANNADARAAQDQSLQQAAAARADAAAAREQARFDQERQDRVTGMGASESERKSASFLERATGAEGEYARIDSDPSAPGIQPIGPRSLPGTFLQNHFPGTLNSLPSGVGNSPERQQSDAAQREFIAAVLRYDSGAAIPPSEFDSAAQIYYPQPGDGPDVIAQKARARARAIDGLRAAAGRMAPQQPPMDVSPVAAGINTLTAATAMSPQPGGNGPNAQPDPNNPFAGMDPSQLRTAEQGLMTAGVENMPRMSPEQEASWNGFVQQNAGRMTPELLSQWYAQNGNGWSIDPNSEAATKWIDAINSGQSTNNAINYGMADEQYQQRMEQRAQDSGLRDAGGGGIGQTADAFIRGGADAVTLGMADEIAAMGDTVMNGGTYQDNVDYQRYVDQRDTQNNGWSRMGGQFAGALVGPGRRVGGVARAVGPERAALEGAALGGAYGVGSGTDAQSRIGGGILGAGIGSVAGVAGNALAPYIERGVAASGRGVNALMSRARAPANAIDEAGLGIIAAGERQGIPIRQPDVRPETRADFGAAEASVGGNELIGQTLASDASRVQGRVREIAGAGTARGDGYDVGSMAQNVANRSRQNLKDRASRNYAIVERLAPDLNVQPTQTLAAIDDIASRLEASGANANRAEVGVLRGIADDLRTSGLTVESLQTQRRLARNLLRNAGVDLSASEGRIGAVMQAAQNELEAGLSSNPNALDAFRRANALWAERSQFTREVSQVFNGTRNNPLSPEKAAERLNAMFKPRGDSTTASRLIQEMDPAERADMAATVAEGMLTSPRTGEPVGMGALATNIENLNPRVARELFGEDGFRAMKDIQAIARARSDATSRVNRSNTGVVETRNNGTFRTLIMSAMGGNFAGIPGALAAGAAGNSFAKFSSRRTARLLLNPDFTRWLRTAPETVNPRAIQSHLNRLETIASRDAVAAADIHGLQQYLMQAFSQSPTRAAATGQQEQNSGQIPPQ